MISCSAPIHYANLVEHATPFSPTGQLLAQITALYQSRGLDVLHAQAVALRLVGLQIRLQATILAFRDAFLLAAIIVACGGLLAFMLRPPQALRKARADAEPVMME